MRRFLCAAVAAFAITTTIGFAASPAVASPAVGYDNTRDVCTRSAKIMQDRLTQFSAQMDQVSAALSRNDNAAAERLVDDAGATLVALAGQLRTEASTADAENLRATLNSLADEFEQQGRALNSVAAMRTIDVQAINALADRLMAVCQGATASPGLSTPASPGTATPTSPSETTPASPSETTPESPSETTPGSPGVPAPTSPTR